MADYKSALEYQLNSESPQIQDINNQQSYESYDPTTASDSYTYEDGSQTQEQSYGMYSLPPQSEHNDDDRTFNIFVGDLKSEVTEEDLISAFTPCGEIASAHIFRDPHTHEQKGFGFVHFKTSDAQARALSEEFNHIAIQGRPCRVSASEQKTTLFVGNLPVEMNQHEIQEAIAALVGVGVATIELKTGPPPAYESRGFCFVSFTSHSRADGARKVLQASNIRGRSLNVSWAESRFGKHKVDEETMAKVKTLFVSNISVTVSEQVLIALFSEHGTPVSCNIVKNPQTKQSRGFAFVEMDTRENAEKALQALDGRELVGQKISVVLAKPPPPKVHPTRRVSRGRVMGTPFQPQPFSPYPNPPNFTSARPYLAHGGRQRGFQGRGGKQRGHGQYPGYQSQGTNYPARYSPYQQSRQPYQAQVYQSQPYQMGQVYPGQQMYNTAAQYYPYTQTDPNAQYYQQYYPYNS